MVAKERIRHMTRLFRKTIPPSKPKVLELPLEIILMIVTYFDDCDLFSLALTCKSLYSLSKRRSMPLQSAQNEKLLLLLEKDFPFLYYCHRCIKLHRWHSRRGKPITTWYDERLLCKRNPDHHLFLPPTCQIPYYYARLVMNRHLYGPEHGLPLKILNIRYISGVGPQHARIFNNQLMVQTVISIEKQRYCPDSLRVMIDRNENLVCMHLAIQRQFSGHLPESPSVPKQIPELADVPGRSVPYGLSFGSCIYCLTDYSVEKQWRGTRDGCKIEINVYRWLGDCRSPFSWEWRTISKVNSGAKLRSAHSPDYKPGFVREKWNEAEAAEAATKYESGKKKWF